MTLVTIDGHIGAGASELGRRVARMFDLDYIDRLVLPGSETGAETDTAEQPQRRSHERFWAFVEKAIRGIALGNAAGDPYYAAPEIMLMPLTWDTSPGAPMARNKAETDGQSVRHTIESLIVKGGAVLVHRAGAVATPSSASTSAARSACCVTITRARPRATDSAASTASERSRPP